MSKGMRRGCGYLFLPLLMAAVVTDSLVARAAGWDRGQLLGIFRVVRPYEGSGRGGCHWHDVGRARFLDAPGVPWQTNLFPPCSPPPPPCPSAVVVAPACPGIPPRVPVQTLCHLPQLPELPHTGSGLSAGPCLALWTSPAQLPGSWCSKTQGFSFPFSPQSPRESPENPQEEAGYRGRDSVGAARTGAELRPPTPQSPTQGCSGRQLCAPGHPADLWVRPGCAVPRARTWAPSAIACSVSPLCPEPALPCSDSHGMAQPAEGPCRRCRGSAPGLGELRLLRAAETRDGNNLGKAQGSATAPGDQARIPAAAPGRPC